VYALTSTGRESHLAYILTLPEKLDQVQKDLGLKDKGSFILSTKNPEYPGPANAQLPEGPGFSKKYVLASICTDHEADNAEQDHRRLSQAPLDAIRG
jgi:hypothetical protein